MKNQKRKKVTIALLLLATFLVGVGVVYSNYIGNNRIIFTVQGVKYRQKEVNELVAYLVDQQKLDKDKAAKAVMADIKIITAADELGIYPSDKQVELQKSIITEGLNEPDKSKNYNLWFELEAKKAAINAYINNKYKPGYKGYSYVFYFGQHLQYGYGPKPVEINNLKLVAQDKSNAKKAAEYYHNAIKSGAMDPNQALKKVLSDPKIVTSDNLVLKQSSKFGFNPKTSWSEDIIPEAIKNFVSEQTDTGISPIHTGKGAQAPGDSKDKFVKIYYYFVYLDETDNSNSVTKTQFDGQLNQVETQYKGFGV